MLVLAAERAGFGLAVLLCGLVVLLLLGTQILDWYWLAMLACAAVPLSLLRVRARPLTPYRLAQVIDRRLTLSDSLSTAWFLLDTKANGSIARMEIERAETMAHSIRLARAIPFTRGRAWMVSGGLAVVAFGLFTVRYLVTGSLDLKEAVIPFRGATTLETANESRPAAEQDGVTAPFSPQARAQLAQTARAQDREAKPQSPQLTNAGDPAGASAGTPNRESGDSSTRSSDPGQRSGDPSRGDARSQEQATNGEHARQEPTGAPSSPNLLDNMRDALSSLLSKMQSNSNTQSPTARQSADQHSTSQATLGRERQTGQTGIQKDQTGEQQNAAGDSQQAGSEKSQAARARSSADSSARNGSDSRSGIGRQDGNKDLKEAEQLEAMGKLAEIIGKRSADLTGDMTVETPSGKQQLKTEYSEHMGHHADLGGEINRDEIPLIYQQYVRDYMEAVRKERDRPSPP